MGEARRTTSFLLSEMRSQQRALTSSVGSLAQIWREPVWPLGAVPRRGCWRERGSRGPSEEATAQSQDRAEEPGQRSNKCTHLHMFPVKAAGFADGFGELRRRA